MREISLERLGELLEAGILGFGALWAACALVLAL